MAINFRCPQCNEPQKVSDHLAGLHWECHNCFETIVVPEPVAHAAENSQETDRTPPGKQPSSVEFR